MKIYLNLAAFAIFGMLLASCQSNEPVLNADRTDVESPHLIPLEKALENADNMFSIIGEGKTRANRKVKDVSMFMKGTRAENGDNLHGFYVVNYENDGGFALLSADDRRADAVYAIAPEGSLELKDTIENKGLSWYLNAFLPNVPLGIPDTPRPVNPGGGGDTVPMLDFSEQLYKLHSEPILNTFMSQFHQESPYNKYCFDKYGNQILAGCVTVCVGTVVGFKEFPSKIGGYTFNWASMKINRYHDSWARLFGVLGGQEYIAVEPDGQGNTVAYTSSVLSTFKKLGYNEPTLISYNESKMIENLENGELLIMRGDFRDFNPGSGHMFLIDGGFTTKQRILDDFSEHPFVYRKYYHCLWGRKDAEGNGYYLYSNGLGGEIYEHDAGTTGTYWALKNLSMIYGFEPQK